MSQNRLIRSSLPVWIASLLAAAGLGASAYAGNGEGHNGLTLSPISVPGVDERGLGQWVADRARRICLTKGDQYRGIKSVLQKLGERAYGVAFRSYKTSRGGKAYYRTNVGPLGGSVTLHWHPSTRSHDIYDFYLVGYHDERTYSDDRPEFYLNKQMEMSEGTPEAWYERRVLKLPDGVSLPRITYESLEAVSDFDELMEPINTRNYLKHPALEISTPGRVYLINNKSGRQTKLAIDMDAYADCLKNEIQRKAK